MALMRVHLTGINFVTKILKDGTKETYYYAWKGGPRLEGKPGSPEFNASYNKAIEQRVPSPKGVLKDIIQGYQKSQDYLRLAEETRRGKRYRIAHIEAKFGDFPLKALPDKRTRGIFLEWRDDLALKSPAQADLYWADLNRIFTWGVDRGPIDTNPCADTPKLYEGTRIEEVWSFEQDAIFYENAPDHMQDAHLLAEWTGQRETDLVNLTWANYDTRFIRLVQSKRRGPGKPRKRVTIPVGAPLKRRLDALKRERGIVTPEDHKKKILLNSYGNEWADAQSFSKRFHSACVKAGIAGRTFHDLRRTAVVRLAIAECTEAQIASITGHSLGDVKSILETHYLYLDPLLAEAAIRKLEKLMGFPTELPTDPKTPEFLRESVLTG